MKDFDIIKKKFGENFAKFCRSHFSTILEQEGLLSKVLLDKFHPNRELYDDLIQNDLTDDFIGYFYNSVGLETNNAPLSTNTPKELFEMAGYDLYHCKTQEDVDFFSYKLKNSANRVLFFWCILF